MRMRVPLLVLGSGVMALLLRFPPERFDFYPRCPIYESFGLLCPGCGLTRALAAVLHGRWLDAFACNPLCAVLVPLGLLAVLVPGPLARAWRHSGRTLRASLTTATLLLLAAFTVARNL